MKSFARVAVAGVASIALFKLFTAAVIPLMGITLGLVMLMVKLAMVAAVVYFLYAVLRPREDDAGDVEPVEVEEEIEIIVEDVEEPGGE